MSRPSMANVRSLPDFATVYNWNISMPRPPMAPIMITTMDVESEFNLRCFSTDVPKKDPVGNIDIWIRGHHTKQPGIYDATHTLNLAMLETVDNKISTFLRAWREACYESNTGSQSTKDNVSAIVRLSRLNRQDEEIWEYIITGCFLESYEPTGGTPLDGSTSDIIRPTMILSYDDFTDGPVGFSF